MSFDDAPEVPLPKSPGLDKRDGETDARGMCRDSGPDDPAADDEQVELPRRELSIALARESAMRGWCRTSGVLVGCGRDACLRPRARARLCVPPCVLESPHRAGAGHRGGHRGRARYWHRRLRARRGTRLGCATRRCGRTSLSRRCFSLRTSSVDDRVRPRGPSFVYPIARGSAPVLVLLGALAILGEKASGAQVVGVLAIAAGVLLVRGIHGRATLGDLALALAVGACIASYTLSTQRGIRYASPSSTRSSR